MPLNSPRLSPGLTSLYAHFAGTAICVAADPLTGGGLNVCYYSCSDADILAKALPFGPHDGSFALGDPDAPSIDDPVMAIFSGFYWQGTTGNYMDVLTPQLTAADVWLRDDGSYFSLDSNGAGLLEIAYGNTINIKSRLPPALIANRIDAHVGAMANNVITAASTSADYVSEIAAAVGTGGGGSAAQVHNNDIVPARVAKLGRRFDGVMKAYPQLHIPPGYVTQVWIDCSAQISHNVPDVLNGASSVPAFAVDSFGMLMRYVSLVVNATVAAAGEVATITCEVPGIGPIAVDVIADAADD